MWEKSKQKKWTHHYIIQPAGIMRENKGKGTNKEYWGDRGKEKEVDWRLKRANFNTRKNRTIKRILHDNSWRYDSF